MVAPTANYTNASAGSPTDNPIDYVQQVPLLAGIPEDEIARAIAGRSTVRRIRERHTIYQQDDRLEWLWILLEGRAMQSRRAPKDQSRSYLRRVFEPGDVLGKYEFLYRIPYQATVQALEGCVLFGMDSLAVNRLIHQYPEVRKRLANIDKISRMRTIPFLSPLNLTELSYLADAFEAVEYGKDELIYGDEDAADSIILLDEGQVQLKWPTGRDVRVGNGMALGFADFGEDRFDINGDVPDTGHSAVATAPTSAFVIRRSDFRDIAGFNPDAYGREQRNGRLRTISSLPVFANYTPEELSCLLGYMSFHQIADHHHLLMQQGELGDSMWILMEGCKATEILLDNGVEVSKTPKVGPMYFGEQALWARFPRTATVDAEPDSQWLQLHRADFYAFAYDYSKNERDRLRLIDALNMDKERTQIKGDDAVRERYDWLREGERLVHFQQRHWIALVRKIIAPALLTLMALVLFLILLGLPLEGWVRMMLLSPLILLTVGWWMWGVADYLNDYILVTSQRVVRQEKILLINELRQTAYLRQVQNVDTSQTFNGKLFGYGTLNVQTAGSIGSIVFDRVADPDNIKNVIFAERSIQLQNYSAESKRAIQDALEARLGMTLKMPTRVRKDADSFAGAPGQTQSRWRRYWHNFTMRDQLNFDIAEKIVWRKHWFVLLRTAFMPGLTTLASLFMVLLVVTGSSLLTGLPFATGWALALPFILITLFSMGWFGWIYVDWRNDTYEIDGEQIIDVEKKPFFFSEEKRTARLDDIENVELSIPSPIHYILNFGNVELQTAATDGDFTFDYVPNPRQVSEEIRRRIENLHRKRELDAAKQRARELPDWFETYNRLDADRSGMASQ